MTPTRSLARLAPIVIIGIIAVLGLIFLRDTVSFDTLRDNRNALLAFRDANYLASIGAFVLVYILIVSLSLPGATVATLTGGFLFGVMPGFLFNLFAASTGASAIFLATRWGLGDWLAGRMEVSDGRISKIRKGIDENLWSMLLLMRLVPAVPFFVANLLPGLWGVPLTPYVVTTVLGILPGTLIVTSVGAGLGDVFASGSAPDLGAVLTPQILLPLLGLCLLVAVPLLVRLVRRRMGT